MAIKRQSAPDPEDKGDFYILLKASDALRIKSYLERIVTGEVDNQTMSPREIFRLIDAVTLHKDKRFTGACELIPFEQAFPGEHAE